MSGEAIMGICVYLVQIVTVLREYLKQNYLQVKNTLKAVTILYDSVLYKFTIYFDIYIQWNHLVARALPQTALGSVCPFTRTAPHNFDQNMHICDVWSWKSWGSWVTTHDTKHMPKRLVLKSHNEMCKNDRKKDRRRQVFTKKLFTV